MKITGALLAIVCAFSMARADVPRFPVGTVFFPTFCFFRGSFSGGTAFVVRFNEPKHDLLVTAHHLFGPACGLKSDLGWDEMPKQIKLAVAVSVDDPAKHEVAKSALTIVGAHALDHSGLDRDIAAFELEPDQTRPVLVLAPMLPKPGEKVWLVGEDYGQNKVELHEALVVRASSKELAYAFDRKGIELRGTSGAPVIDGNGAVVAINIGGEVQNGKQVGIGNPVTSIRKHLEKALAAKK